MFRMPKEGNSLTSGKTYYGSLTDSVISSQSQREMNQLKKKKFINWKLNVRDKLEPEFIKRKKTVDFGFVLRTNSKSKKKGHQKSSLFCKIFVSISQKFSRRLSKLVVYYTTIHEFLLKKIT